MRLHLWFYDMLIDIRKNLSKAVKEGSVTVEDALKAYTDVIFLTIELAVINKRKAKAEE